jgi:hypothetical protein
MKNYKNYLIALLTGLLAIAITGLIVGKPVNKTVPFKGITQSQQVKIVTYDNCLKFQTQKFSGQGFPFGTALSNCLMYLP